MQHEHVVAGLAAALRAGFMTADVLALEARKAAQAETEPTPDARVPGQPSATVTSPHEWRLAPRLPDSRPLPSVAPYDRLLRHRRASGGVTAEAEKQPQQRAGGVDGGVGG
ncbi:hypothetical protein [Streptomyces sp. NPDC001135]